jgi:NADH-quinone oxidoreductase subunit D
MSKVQAEVLGAVGPTARASGIEKDIRNESPYAAYQDSGLKIVVESNGDLEARFVVRIKELFESYRLIRNILHTIPEGDLRTGIPRRIKAGEAITRVEAPRGELFYYIKSAGGDSPERMHIRTPTICNMTSVIKLVIGHQLADVPMILVGIDPCFSCNDRMVIVDDGKEEKQGWTWEELRQYGIEYYYERNN